MTEASHSILEDPNVHFRNLALCHSQLQRMSASRPFHRECCVSLTKLSEFSTHSVAIEVFE